MRVAPLTCSPLDRGARLEPDDPLAPGRDAEERPEVVDGPDELDRERQAGLVKAARQEDAALK